MFLSFLLILKTFIELYFILRQPCVEITPKARQYREHPAWNVAHQQMLWYLPLFSNSSHFVCVRDCHCTCVVLVFFCALFLALSILVTKRSAASGDENVPCRAKPHVPTHVPTPDAYFCLVRTRSAHHASTQGIAHCRNVRGLGRVSYID